MFSKLMFMRDYINIASVCWMVVTCATWYLDHLLPHTSKCPRPVSPTQCSTTEVNWLFCLLAMAFIANSKNKARLIDKLTTELQGAGVLVKQDQADADHIIVSTALTLAQTERKPVIVVGTYTDLLVMFISQSSSDMDIHMLCHIVRQ